MRRQPSQLSRRECSSNGIVEAVLAPTNARDMINEIENRSSHLLAYNFERRYDLVRFMKITHKTGLYAHLRIGPYVYVHVFKTIEANSNNVIIVTKMASNLDSFQKLLLKKAIFVDNNGTRA
ncbi:hypothetical protein AHAS_Ahas12G0169900 [Arachis hypogaea]